MPSTITIAAVGDVSLAAAPSSRKTQPASVFKHVAPLLQDADLALCNLECCLSERGKPAEKSYVFRAAPDTTLILKNAGIDLVSLANNHSVDYGRTALLDTLGSLQKHGIDWIGAGRSLTQARKPCIYTFGAKKKAVRVAFLAFSNMQPNDFFAGKQRCGTTPAIESFIKADVKAAAKQADFTIVTFHWGVERASAPRKREQRLAHLAIDAGADLVLGGHPHVLQGIERYNKGLIAYSLGNFVFGNRRSTQDTIILRAHLRVPHKITLEVIPIVIHKTTPYRAHGKQATRILKHMNSLSTRLGSPLTIKRTTATIVNE